MVFGLAVADGRLRLVYLAFGLRHHRRGSSAQTAYEIAHQRLHRDPPARANHPGHAGPFGGYWVR